MGTRRGKRGVMVRSSRGMAPPSALWATSPVNGRGDAGRTVSILPCEAGEVAGTAGGGALHGGILHTGRAA